MNGRLFLWVAVVLSGMMSLCVGEAEAGRFQFGTDETIHRIQDTNDPQYELCYKTSIFFFGAGCYVTDDGYVLRKKGESKSYVPLTAAQITSLQTEGTLPNPLPKYSLSIFDYLFGYSNWIILALVFGIPAISKAIRGTQEPQSTSTAAPSSAPR